MSLKLNENSQLSAVIKSSNVQLLILAIKFIPSIFLLLLPYVNSNPTDACRNVDNKSLNKNETKKLTKLLGCFLKMYVTFIY